MGERGAPTRGLLLVLVVLAVAPYWTRLGATSIIDANEAFYAETPREMIEAGDYLSPSFNYAPRFNKPPLTYWVVAAFYHAFGVSEGVARIPIALGATILIATAFGLAAVLYSVEAGLWAALVLATTPRFLLFSRRIIVDVYVAMFMGLTLLFFVLAERWPGRRRLFLGLMYLSIGLGTLTKGPIAILLPGAAFLVYLLLTRRVSHLGALALPMGVGLVTAIVLPWYALVYRAHGWQYIGSFLASENVARFTGELNIPRRGLFFYVPVVLGDQFPWSLLLPLAAWPATVCALFFLRKLRSRREAPATPPGDVASQRELELLLLVWAGVIIGFFSLSATKQDLYILPIVPATAALLGGLVARVIGETASPGARTTFRALLGVTGVAVVMAGTAVLAYFAGPDARFPVTGAGFIGGISIGGGVLVLIGLARRRDGVAVLSLTAAVTALLWVTVLVVLPGFERYKPVPAMANIIRERAGREAVVGYYRLAVPSLVFYLERPVFEAFDPRELIEVFAAGRDVYCLMTARDYEAVRSSLPVSTRVIATRPMFDVKWSTILEDEAPGEVVLVSNAS